MDKKMLNGAIMRGNQMKFIKDGYFYKVDWMGYESISEVLVATFLAYIDDIEFIDYELELIISNHQEYHCCRSKLYNKDNESFISVFQLLKFYDRLEGMKKINGKELVTYVIDNIKDITGIDITSYLTLLSMIDYIILNEDRHLNNICFIECDGKFRVAPIFDNGISLLSDTRYNPMGYSIERLTRKVKCKPFSTSFKKQLSYFSITPLVFDYDGFMDRLSRIEKNIDDYIIFKKKEYYRASSLLVKRIRESEGYLWVKK